MVYSLETTDVVVPDRTPAAAIVAISHDLIVIPPLLCALLGGILDFNSRGLA